MEGSLNFPSFTQGALPRGAKCHRNRDTADLHFDMGEGA